MENPLQKQLNDLFDLLKVSVTDLEKQEARLKQSCTSLEARETFLKKEIKQLQAKKEAELAAQQVTQDAATKKLKQAEDRFIELEHTQAELTRDYRLQHDGLRTKVAASEKQLSDTQQELLERQKAVKALETEKATLLAQLAELQKKFDHFGAKLTEVKDSVVAAEKEAKSNIAAMQIPVAQAKQKLDTIHDRISEAESELTNYNEKIQMARKKLTDIDKQRKDFIEYEKRAKKALLAREEALLKKEQLLDIQVVTSRRRNGVLDNIE